MCVNIIVYVSKFSPEIIGLTAHKSSVKTFLKICNSVI